MEKTEIKKILIVVRQYPPDIIIAARRWGGLVPGLINCGFKCTVIAAADGFPKSYEGKYGEKVYRIRNYHLDRKTKEKLNNKVNPQTKKVRNKFIYNIKYFMPSILRDKRIIVKEKSLKGLIELANDSDFIVSSFGPIGPFMLGYSLAKIANKPWIADIRDSFEARDASDKKLAKWISRRIEYYLLKKAKLRITVGTYLSQYLMKLYGLTFHAIYNGWTGDDLIRKEDRAVEEKQYLFYAGSIYNDILDSLSLLLKSMKNFNGIYLKIRLIRDYSNGTFSKMIEDNNLSAFIEILPPVSQETVHYELSKSLGGIMLGHISDSTELLNAWIRGKLLGLLASGVPGIALCSKESEINYMVNKVNGWFAIDSVEECTNAIEKLRRKEKHYDNSKLLFEFNMEEQAKKLAELLKEIS